MKEIWKPIKGYEGYYEVSNKGNVRSLDRTITINYKSGIVSTQKLKGLLLKPTKDRDGYLRVGLRTGGKRWTIRVHRLVAIAFIPNPGNKPDVNHIDNNLENCCVSNLEWVTQRENRQHSVQTNRNLNKFWGKRPVFQIDINTGTILAEFDSVSSAARSINCTHQQISKVCQGLAYTTRGYIWVYQDRYSNSQVEKLIEHIKFVYPNLSS
ncbi:MAG: NUMOD4 domain-containing protein [Bacillota bacterium]